MADVVAPVTGTVWKIVVEVGREVTVGETVVVLESMKMEIPVEASDAGRVLAIHVAEGVAVDEGTLLVTLE